jgi:hypothetical protein
MSEAVPERPTLRVVSGNPSAEELAVLTAVMSATGSVADAPRPPGHGRWNDPAMLVRRPLRAGAGAWQAAVR